MSTSPFSKIDLSKLPAPEALVEMSFDDILEELSAQFKADNPEIAESLNFESEPISALNQAWVYREQQLRAYWNTLFKQTFLAFATGNTLDQHAALIPLKRLDGQSDDDFRADIQLAPEGFSTAGPVGAYIFHALRASHAVSDVYVPEVTEETKGRVDVYILLEDGADEATILAQVNAALSDDKRPLNDFVSVLPAMRVDFEIEATLSISEGPDSAVVVAAAQVSAQAYINSRLKFGKAIYRTALAASLVVPGVENAELIEPAADIIIAPNAAARLTSISVASTSETGANND